MNKEVCVALPADLPGKLTLTSLELNPNIPYDQWETIFQQLFAMERGSRWWLGDSLNYGEKSYGDTYVQATEFTGLALQTLTDYKWVASRYEFSLRNENLSWSHHRIAAPLEPKLRQKVLCQAEKEGWSVAELKKFLNPESEVHVSQNSGEIEWYTPPKYIEAAREVLGSIDLDPASCKLAQETVQAKTFFTQEEDGLVQPWRGRVFLNPPYTIGLITKFVEKLCHHFEAGMVPEAIVLVNNATETEWFSALTEQASAICFPAGRVKFLDPEGNPGAPLQGQAVVYLGECPERFVQRFRDFGKCWKEVEE
jgi:hypothetical protein